MGEALYVKSLKNTSNNPQQANWPLMMKNVYYLASNIEKTKFRLDIKFQSDTTGVYLSYIPEVKDITLLRGLGCDRLDNNNKVHPNGYFDYVEGYTVTNGRVFFPSAEPFGSTLKNFLIRNGVSEDVANKYAFQELYDTTRTAARQMTNKDKFLLVGQFKGSAANVISLGAYNVPQGSVVVTAGGVTLTEGSDYSVDYSAGEVTILNQSIIDAGTSVNVSLESNTEYGMQRKTIATPERAGADVESRHGFRTAEEHPLGRQHQLEDREPVAYPHAQQDSPTPLHAALADYVYGRICTAHCRNGQRHTGQRLIH